MRPLSKLPYGVPNYAEDNSPGVQGVQSPINSEKISNLPPQNKDESVNIVPIINSAYRADESGDDGASLVSSPDNSD